MLLCRMLASNCCTVTTLENNLILIEYFLTLQHFLSSSMQRTRQAWRLAHCSNKQLLSDENWQIFDENHCNNYTKYVWFAHCCRLDLVHSTVHFPHTLSQLPWVGRAHTQTHNCSWPRRERQWGCIQPSHWQGYWEDHNQQLHACMYVCIVETTAQIRDIIAACMILSWFYINV